MGDISAPLLRRITEKLYLLPGDVALSSFEDILSVEWPKALGDSNLYRPMRILSAFWQIMDAGASDVEASRPLFIARTFQSGTKSSKLEKLLEKTLGKLGREHCQQHGVRLDRPVKAYDKWVQRIPRVYREA